MSIGELRIPVFQEHRDYFAEVLVQLIERFPLRVRTREARYVAHVEPSVRTLLDDSREGLHTLNSTARRKPAKAVESRGGDPRGFFRNRRSAQGPNSFTSSPTRRSLPSGTEQVFVEPLTREGEPNASGTLRG